MEEDWDDESTWPSNNSAASNFSQQSQYNRAPQPNGWDDNWGSSMHNNQPDFGAARQSSNSRGRGRGRGFARSNDGNFSEDRRSFGDRPGRSRGEDNFDFQGNNFGGRPNRREGGQDSLVLEISDRDVGKIIGRGGSKIRELQDDSGAKINVSRDKSNGLVPVEISGSEEAKSKAKELIDDLLNSFDRSRSFGGGFNQGQREQSSRDFGPPAGGEETKMEVGTRDLGRLIGPGGAKIRELQDESGARIKIRSEDGDRFCTPVVITGTTEACEKAKTMINEHLGYKDDEEDNDPAGCLPGGFIDWDALREASKNYEKIKFKDCAPVEKEFYFEDPEVTNMPRREAEKIRMENNNIMLEDLHPDPPGPIPNPVTKFTHAFAHYPEILEEIRKQGFTEPSPIQKQGWPILLQGRDMIAVAQTGTGKTLLFLLPAFIHIEGQPTPREQRKGPTVLILSPTRELALQIEQEVKKYSYRGIKCVCVYGGGSRKNQINVVSSGVEIIVATPGRLNDLVMNKIVDLKSVSYMVLDEADRMLDLGFEPEIKKILIDIRPDRQTIMTSATWPLGVQDMADNYLKNPIKCNVGSLDLTAVHSVLQLIEVIPSEDKRERLDRFLRDELGPNDKAIVFCGRKATADDVASDLILQGINVQSLHGDREQCDREQALQDLKTGFVRILIATDVASRGLDVVDVTHVFNFDFPRHMEEYVHRVGRTGRAGRSGVAITLMTREDWRQADKLIKILVEANQEVPVELEQMAERYQAFRQRMQSEGGGFRRGGRGGGGRGGGGRFGGRRREEDACRISYGIA